MSSGSFTHHVFVYGTLRKGQANDINMLQPPPEFLGSAQVCGTLYHLGRYPGLLLHPDGQNISGEVYAISGPLERKLDEIESLYPQETDEYFKRQIVVHVNAIAVDCLIYEINPRYVKGKPVIASGDWSLAATSDT
jgi:gamma-glutamylcyclotransferase (GGCT)/AIG2-like uncharacterized protein YtfP